MGLEADKILFILMSSEASDALSLIELPHFQVAVGAGTHKLVLAAKLDIGDGLLVALVERDGLLGIPQVIVMNRMIGRAEQHMKLAVGLEHAAAHVRFGVDGQQRVLAVGGPDFDLGVVRGRAEQTRVHIAKLNAPAALLVLLVRTHQRARLGVPQRHNSLVVTARQLLTKVAVPADARQLGIVGHFVERVVHAVWPLQNVVEIEYFDAFGHACHGEMLVGAVKVNRAHNA